MEMSTIRVPEVVPTPAQDSERLHKAFEGWGTDEKAVIWVLGHRNPIQRKKIRDTYQQLYDESLLDRLHSELTGDFRKAVISWTLDPPERDAKLVNEILKKKKKKGARHFQVIVEIACSTHSDHLMAVRQSYCSLFDCSLEEDIISNVAQPLTKLFVALVSSYRYHAEVMDLKIAESEATKLYSAIKSNKLDDDQLIWILSTRNVYQLRLTFHCYLQNYGHPIDQDIKNCGSGELESLLQLVVLCIDAPERHFAGVVRASVEGFGTDEDTLTRAIVSRAEIDMKKIKGEYYESYKTSLEDAVIDDTSGDYKDFLLTLLGARF